MMCALSCIRSSSLSVLTRQRQYPVLFGRRYATKHDDPYEILGVQRDASIAQIKKAYLLKAKKNHPDLVHSHDENGKKEAEQRFIAISDAYQTLVNPEMRSMIDVESSFKQKSDEIFKHSKFHNKYYQSKFDQEDQQKDEKLRQEFEEILRKLEELSWYLRKGKMRQSSNQNDLNVDDSIFSVSGWASLFDSMDESAIQEEDLEWNGRDWRTFPISFKLKEKYQVEGMLCEVVDTLNKDKVLGSVRRSPAKSDSSVLEFYPEGSVTTSKPMASATRENNVITLTDAYGRRIGSVVTEPTVDKDPVRRIFFRLISLILPLQSFKSTIYDDINRRTMKLAYNRTPLAINYIWEEDDLIPMFFHEEHVFVSSSFFLPLDRPSTYQIDIAIERRNRIHPAFFLFIYTFNLRERQKIREYLEKKFPFLKKKT